MNFYNLQKLKKKGKVKSPSLGTDFYGRKS